MNLPPTQPHPLDPPTWPLHDIAITNIVCCMAKQGEAGGNRIMRNIDCNIERGGVAIHDVLNAKNSID